MALTRDQIIQARDLPIESVDVPEWGDSVNVRGLTGAERDAYQAQIVKIVGKEPQVILQGLRAKLVARCIVDEHGLRLFSDEDAAVLATKSATALDRVFEIAQRLSGLGAADVEEMVKNSASSQSDDSGLS